MSLDPQLKTRLAELVKEHALVHGKVTLSSGKEADYYVDMRRVTLQHEAAPIIGHLLLDKLEEEGMGVGESAAVGGPTMGADPVVCAGQGAAASRGLAVDAFLVCREWEGHGSCTRRVRGAARGREPWRGARCLPRAQGIEGARYAPAGGGARRRGPGRGDPGRHLHDRGLHPPGRGRDPERGWERRRRRDDRRPRYRRP